MFQTCNTCIGIWIWVPGIWYYTRQGLALRNRSSIGIPMEALNSDSLSVSPPPHGGYIMGILWINMDKCGYIVDKCGYGPGSQPQGRSFWGPGPGLQAGYIMGILWINVDKCGHIVDKCGYRPGPQAQGRALRPRARPPMAGINMVGINIVGINNY